MTIRPLQSDSSLMAVKAPPKKAHLGRLANIVGFRLRRVQNQLSSEFAAATAARGLRSGLFSSLAIIEANPGIFQREVSDAIGQDKSIVVTIVDQLEAFGWAQRRRSPTDRRRHALYITPEGEAHLDELTVLVTTTEQEVLHTLTSTEHLILNELLDRMYIAARHGER